ncbi:hypothetical protein CAPTEDRAFT_117366 [Capitella teleta]|uniref:glutathione transferase n=1 Tax=Capitella teleta TaxID=283909 RepID=R7UIF8_CAPTE|nr:hypothetical protein CAPTEDRAFT_117366 [Capitella teleta]|eukprot:ELU06349.1 hypothetical protein CAPTEDRAFT_117366 [Capitella teleta]
MPTYQLKYFNIKGLVEPARWFFALAGQPYKDHRFQEGEWPSVKPTTPCGQAPILVVDGKQIAQSKAVFRYLAKQFGLVGETDMDQARGDMIVDHLEDFTGPLRVIRKEGDPPKKKELMAKFMATLPIYLGNLEKLLKENNDGDGFFVGEKVTWTDVVFVCNTEIHKRFLNPGYLADYPKLEALVQRVEALPAIAEWIKTRPVTDV